MKEQARDSQDRIEEKPQNQQHEVSVDHREVTPGAVAEARKPGMEQAQKTTHDYFGSLTIHDGSAASSIEARQQGGRAKTPDESKAPPAGNPEQPGRPGDHEKNGPTRNIPTDRDANSTARGDKPGEKGDKPAEKTDKPEDSEDRKKSREILDRIAKKDKDVSEKFLNDLKDDLSKLPSKDLKKLEDAGIKIRAMHKLPGEPAGGGPGVFDGRHVMLSETGVTTFPDGRQGDMKNDAAARGMAGAHEVGHALSAIRGQEKDAREGLDSNSRGFKAAHDADRKAGWKETPGGNRDQDESAKGLYKYHAHSAEEAYAQAYSMESKLVSPEQKKIWQKQFPKTSEWMHHTQERDLK